MAFQIDINVDTDDDGACHLWRGNGALTKVPINSRCLKSIAFICTPAQIWTLSEFHFADTGKRKYGRTPVVWFKNEANACDTGVYTGTVFPAPIKLVLLLVFRFFMGVYTRKFTSQCCRWVHLLFCPDFVLLWLLHALNDTPRENKHYEYANMRFGIHAIPIIRAPPPFTCTFEK